MRTSDGYGVTTTANRSNLKLMDLDTAIEEVRKYREVGGGAIVDATTTGIGRNPSALA